MRVLLNVTPQEIRRLGGDFTLYGDWLRLRGDNLSFQTIPSRPLRRWNAFLRKVWEKSCHTWQPGWIRRPLFLASRYLYVPPAALKGVDLIFSHLLYPLLSPGPRVPVIWSSQGISPPAYYQRYNRGQWTVEDVAYVYRVLGRKASALVIATEACARNVVKWCPELEEKVHVVPAPVFSGLDGLPVKPSARDGVLRLLFVGVDAERKGLPEVMEAFRALRTRHGDLLLEVVSRPPPELREELETLDGVHFYLSSPAVDVKELMSQADIFVLPTHADTYALAAVEAMAHGCAVIISDLEPLPEVVPEGIAGFNVPAGDVEALVGKLEQLIHEPKLLRQMQEGAYETYLQCHHPEVVVEKLREVFKWAIQSYRA